jgi:hypothetical protein
MKTVRQDILNLIKKCEFKIAKQMMEDLCVKKYITIHGDIEYTFSDGSRYLFETC